jgi:hypothetical protein
MILFSKPVDGLTNEGESETLDSIGVNILQFQLFCCQAISVKQPDIKSDIWKSKHVCRFEN